MAEQDVTAVSTRETGVARPGLLATVFAMAEPFYRERLATHDLAALVLDAAGRDVVHRIIYDELCRGVFSEPPTSTSVTSSATWSHGGRTASSSAVLDAALA